tara:strand:- start:178 stop:624 length:447 start_codon:yes stop_codon:yes gene_type:complete
MKKILLAFLPLIFISYSTNLDSAEIKDCSTKKLQQMRPTYPVGIGSIEGYSVVSYDIMENGDVNNIKVIDSQCVQFDENEDIYFKKCPFFKNVSMGAAMYFKYTPPQDANGDACTIKDKLHKYNFQRMRAFHELIDSYNGPESIETKK